MTRPEPNAPDVNLLDRISELTGRLTAWLTLAMVIVTFVIVIMRYVFDAGLIWLQDADCFGNPSWNGALSDANDLASATTTSLFEQLLQRSAVNELHHQIR